MKSASFQGIVCHDKNNKITGVVAFRASSLGGIVLSPFYAQNAGNSQYLLFELFQRHGESLLNAELRFDASKDNQN